MSTLSFVFFLVNNMSIHKRYMAYRKGELYHYNKNHDPKNGQFTSGPGGSNSAVAASRDPKFDDPDYHSYYQDDEVWAKAEGVIYDKVIPKLNGAVRDDDDPELADITAMELADYFYSEYKNYVHDHPEEKGRVDDYVEYVKANATKVDPAFTVRDENNNDGYSVSFEPPKDNKAAGVDSGETNAEFLKKLADTRDFSIRGGDIGGLTEYMLKYDETPKKKMFESEASFNKRKKEAFDNRMAAYTMYADTSQIKDKKEKAETESRIFREISGKESTFDDFITGGVRIAVSSRIGNRSFAEAVSKSLKTLKPVDYDLGTYKDVLDHVKKNVSNEYKKEIPNILRSAGYEDTKEGRDYVEGRLLEEIAETYAELLYEK